MQLLADNVESLVKLPRRAMQDYARYAETENDLHQGDVGYVATPIDETQAKRLLLLWRCRSLRAVKAHYDASLGLRVWDGVLTGINALLSIMILFIANAEWVRVFLDGLNLHWFEYLETVSLRLSDVTISAVAALLVITTILQYILRWGEKSYDHKAAGGEFANLQRKIERYMLAKSVNMAMVHNINRNYNHISKSYPLVSTGRWMRAGKPRLNAAILRLEEELQVILVEGKAI